MWPPVGTGQAGRHSEEWPSDSLRSSVSWSVGDRVLRCPLGGLSVLVGLSLQGARAPSRIQAT